MSNDAKLTVSGKITYPWNPFQDIVASRITGEPHQADKNGAGIIVPRNGPFFSRDVKITLKESGRALSLEAGDYAFLYPFGRFNQKYNRLVWGAIQLKDVDTPIDVEIDYDTIGGDFVLSDIAYAEAVANQLTSPRTTPWENLVNLPTEWQPDPHQHPASDTMNYGDLIVWMTSYMSAVMQTPDATWMSRFEAHLDADLQNAHKATLESLGISHLKDWAMGTENDIKGNSTELLTNIALVKQLICGFQMGQWA